MKRVKQGYKDTKVKEIINTDTGEVIDVSQMGLLQRSSADYISYHSTAYFYLDTEQLYKLLANGIKQVELALLITISSNLMMKTNVCMINDDKPHTTESIAKLIGTTQQSVKRNLKSLEKLGVLHYGILKENKRLGKVYIVNPHIIRKGHKMKQSLGTTFDEIKRQY
jgi:DNA-binding MarR family transcriptional regulator